MYISSRYMKPTDFTIVELEKYFNNKNIETAGELDHGYIVITKDELDILKTSNSKELQKIINDTDGYYDYQISLI